MGISFSYLKKITTFTANFAVDYDESFGKLKTGSVTHPSDSTHVYTGCNRRNVRDFGRVFLMLNYIDITQNTYIQS